MTHFDILDEEAFDIIYNTYRMKVIDAFGSKENMTATFKQIADELGDNSSKVTYHGKMLINLGLLVLDHTESINGITAKYYRLVSDSFRIKFDTSKNPAIKKKIQRGQTTVVMDGLERLMEQVSEMDHEDRNLSFVLNEIHVTKDDLKALWEVLDKYSAMKERREDTIPVTLYSLIINDHSSMSCD